MTVVSDRICFGNLKGAVFSCLISIAENMALATT